MSEQTISAPPRNDRQLTRPKPPRRPLRRLFEWLLVLSTLAALLAAAVAAAILLGERDFALRIVPNVVVRGVPVGGLTPAQARAAIERRYASFLYGPVLLSYGERAWRPSAEELGVRLAVDDAVAQAFALGHDNRRADNLRTAAAAWERGVELPLRLQVDQTAMQRYLLGIAASIDAPPADAALALDGPAIQLTPEAWGVQALVDETSAEITAAMQELEPQPVALRTRALAPRLRAADLAPLAARLHAMLDRPIALSSPQSRCAAACGWQWSPAQIAGWVRLRYAAGAYSVSVDQAAIRKALLPVAAALQEAGSLPRVRWNDGQLQISQPGLPGRGLDANQAMAQVNAALAGGPRSIRLALTPLPPPVNEANLASLGISQQIGLGVSSFARSEQYRITNIGAGARQMDGLLIPPGASFSFNDNLGPVTAETGFVEGYAIIDNRTQKEWGGGLCQVSTTVFRAAFWSGLPIAERHEHSFRIGWYEELGEPPGLDAAIFTGVQDMRFTNDTGGWLLMQSTVDLQRQRLSIALYGPPTGRSVSMGYKVLERIPAPTEPVYVDDPELPAGSQRKTDSARGGLRVEVYRAISAAGRTLARDTFATTFRPWPDIYVRGTGQ
jgi:vancomycin resistance protein YoaR